MSASTSAVVLTSTITLGATGQADDAGTVTPARSSSAIKNLTLIIVPLDDDDAVASYDVTVQMYGQTVETHSFPSTSGKTLAFMTYKDVVFPPSLSGNVIPAFYQNNRQILPSIPITVVIENTKSSNQTFAVYATFEEFDSFRASPQ